MTSKHRNPKAIRYAVCSALAAALVAGCAGSNHLARAGKYSSQPVSRQQSSLDQSVAKAEKEVARNPRDAAARVALADTYLSAGRFESAVTTYNDAIALGDSSPRMALSLALAHIGSGRNREAVAILDQWRDSLPASDFGLALALAGETGRGVAVLSDALREGDNSPKLRQNLAYAYALDGRWREARLMAGQDVPADQLDARISDWAMRGKPEDYRKRVAGLLDAPVRADAGQPEYLALNDVAAPAQADFAAAAPGLTSQPSAPAEAADAELPAVAPAQRHAVAEPVRAAPALSVPVATAEVSSVSFDDAFASPAHVSRPVVQEIPARRAQERQRVVRSAAVSEPAAWPSADSTHLVQLGSFSSPEGARRAAKIFVSRNPELRNFEMTITPAVVGGRNFWRVAAAGFDKRSAVSFCSGVRGKGRGCIAYAADRPLPGALPSRGGTGPMMARR